MRIVVTGAAGFLGWHTRVRLSTMTDHEVIPVGRPQWSRLTDITKKADAVIHLAGINRATDHELEDGNVQLACDVADAVRRSPSVRTLVYANSTQSQFNAPYGRGKAAGARLLLKAAQEVGASFTDIVLPNIYGEHGRPHYNSFVATFANSVISGTAPSIQDRPVSLLHAQEAADMLIAALPAVGLDRKLPAGTPTSVGEVLTTMEEQFQVYKLGDIPVLDSPMQVTLFNTLRAAMFPDFYPIPLTQRTDHRGTLVETVRAHGSEGQTFLSTTRPGITRGQHVHLRKMERFVVIGGEAQISLRRMLTNETVSFEVTGQRPVIVDMPTMWAHKIVNTGPAELTTLFWSNELYNASDPDTYPEEV